MGTNSRRLTDSKVSLSPPVTGQRRVQGNWSKLLPNELIVGPRLTRPAAIEVSCFAQIPGGQRRNLIVTATPSQSVRVIQFDLLKRNPSGCPVGPKRVARKEEPCKCLQSFKENR